MFRSAHTASGVGSRWFGIEVEMEVEVGSGR